MKTIIIYKSITGFTKAYAELIADELQTKAIPLNKTNKIKLNQYDLIIFGGSVHAATIIGLKKLQQITKNLKNKKLIIFATGASPYKEETLTDLKTHNLQDNTTPLFYLRGGFNYNKLPLRYKIIMKLFLYFTKKKKEKTNDDKEMIKAYTTPVNFVNKKNITPIINHIKKK